MTILTFIFSLRGITTIAVLAFFFWLLTGYPQWRAQRIHNNIHNNDDNDNIKTKIATGITSIKQELATTEQQKSDQTTNQETPATEENKPIKDLSLAHYILVTPFAALYILVRAIFDAVRYTLYFVIWSCEKAIPHLDDWLYHTMTVWVPAKYNAIEQWWIHKGQPGLIASVQHFKQEKIPVIIENMEAFFKVVYRIGCIVSSATNDFIHAWKRFTERHDWRQLATDLGNVAYTVLWSPLAWVVTRSIRLAKLVYGGLRSAAISIQSDVVWIYSILIPTVYDYMISTRLAHWAHVGTRKLVKALQSICLGIHEYLIVPTLGRFLTWLVRSIDQLILLLQNHTIQQRLHRIYKSMAPNLVWTVFEFSHVFLEVIKWAHTVCVQLLYPAYKLFMKRVLPRLAIAYQKIVIHWAYQLHLYPAWLKVYPYLNAPLLWAYTNVTVPLLNQIYILVASISNYVTRHLLVKLQIILNMAIEISILYSQQSYQILQSWLLKQAPVLSQIIYNSYQRFLNMCDWVALRQETWLIASSLYESIQFNANQIYLSIERSLNAWAKEQGGTDELAISKQKLA